MEKEKGKIFAIEQSLFIKILQLYKIINYILKIIETRLKNYKLQMRH